MSTAVQALAWQLWGRNRLGLTAMLGVLALGGLVVRLIPAEMRTIGLVKYMVFGAVLVFCYVISIFTYSNFAPGSVHESLRFPRRMFQLPVPTWVLVAVPMLGGMAYCALLWAAIEVLLIRPFGVQLPFTLPALALAVALGFFQALAWSPFGAPIVRAGVATVLGMGAVHLAVWVSLGAEVPVQRPWLLLCGCLALIYPATVLGVSRDRSGGPGGLGIGSRLLEWGSGLLPGRRNAFASGQQAQLWFELRTKGLSYALVTWPQYLFFASFATYLMYRRVPGSSFVFAVAFMTPLWSAAMVGPGLAKPNLWGRAYALPAFMAVRPLATGDLYLAMLRTVLYSALPLWALVWAVTALVLVMIGAPEPLASGWSSVLERHGTLGAWFLGAGLAAALVVLTLGSLISGLTAGLAGRVWTVTGGMFLKSCLFGAVLWSGGWVLARLVARPDWQAAAQGLLAGLVLAKVAAAGWAFRVSWRRGWISTRVAGLLGLGWLCGTALLGTLLMVCVPEGAVPLQSSGLVLCAALLLPLVQPALGPMALDWNRHR